MSRSLRTRLKSVSNGSCLEPRGGSRGGRGRFHLWFSFLFVWLVGWLVVVVVVVVGGGGGGGGVVVVLNQICWSWCYYNEEKMLYPARWKRITVDQSKVLKIDCSVCAFFFWGGGGTRYIDKLYLKEKFSGIEGALASTLNRDFNWKQLSEMILCVFLLMFSKFIWVTLIQKQQKYK